MKKIALTLLAIFSLSFIAEQNIEARRGGGYRGGRGYRGGYRRGYGYGPRIGFGFGGPGYYGYDPYYGGYGYGGPGIGFSIGI